ncbi:hypothetical protein M0R89_12280 [Halorussus limi]|uniref:DUF7310 domain-containing protein n=1 Tax=Halorussus limi TaxID=2938695 RepID=A0A8U0HR50_9EURY|nr:hypothetical protein [Halorussus limi]UPV73321.1 hypothetical protein M0R89_12280 [Halorussus limi]
MSESEALDRRLRAVERALTDDDSDLTDLRDSAELTREVEALSARLDAVDERLDELDGATQALRGYVGNVSAVNESVERRADAALAKAESLESEFDGDREDVAFDGDRTERDADGGRRRSAEHERPCECDSPRATPSRCAKADFEAEDGPRDSDKREADDRGLLARFAEML